MRSVLRALCAAIAAISVVDAKSKDRACGYYVEKTQTSSSTRFLYVTGLANAGGGDFARLVRDQCRGHAELCVAASAVLRTSVAAAFATGPSARAAREHAVSAFRAAAADDTPKLVLMHDGRDEDATYGKVADTVRHPNLHVLAALAELAGVDLRVAVVDRSAAALAASGLLGKAADVLADNAAVLAAQINLIDPGFVARVSIDDLVADDPASDSLKMHDLLGFFHPEFHLLPLQRLRADEDAAATTTTTTPAGVLEDEAAKIIVEKTNAARSDDGTTRDAFEAHVAPMVDALLRSSLGRSLGAAREVASTPNLSPRHVVEKTAFSLETRFLFVAGLEGTGHHAAGTFFRECRKNGPCVSSKVLTSLVYHGGSHPTGVFVYPGDTDPDAVEKRRAMFVDEMRRLAAEGRGLVVLNTFEFNNGSGQVSYPNFLGPNRPLQHANVHELALLAERAGVDLRILVVARSAQEILVSTTQHRHFNSRTGQSAQLADNAAALAAQLQLVDPRFYLCLPYAQFGDLDWWNAPDRRVSVSPSKLDTGSLLAAAPATTTRRADWLHPGIQGDVLQAALESIESKDGPKPLETNATVPNDDAQGLPLDIAHFLQRRDVAEGHLATMVDYLHRTAGCACGG